MTDTTTYLAGADLSKAIVSFHKATKTLEKQAQTLLVAVTVQLIDHRNTEPVNQFFRGLGKGLRTAAIAGWLEKFAPVLRNDNAETKATQPFVLNREFLAAINESPEARAGHIEAAAKCLWTAFKPESDPLEVFDVKQALQSALKGIMSKAGKASTVEHKELIASIQSLIGEEEEEIQGV